MAHLTQKYNPFFTFLQPIIYICVNKHLKIYSQVSKALQAVERFIRKSG